MPHSLIVVCRCV